MYYEDKGYRLELIKRLQDRVNSFFTKEARNEAGMEQLTAVATYNLSNLSYHRLDKYYFFEDFRIESNKAIKHLFTPVNEHDLLAVRLEQLTISLILMFGKELIDELKEDLISHILETKPTKRFEKKYNEVITVSESLPIKAEKREKELTEKEYKEYISDLFIMYPSLWLIPFLKEAFVEHVG